MPNRITLPNGGIEFAPSDDEKQNKNKFKGKKQADLTNADLKELVYKIAKHLNLIE